MLCGFTTQTILLHLLRLEEVVIYSGDRKRSLFVSAYALRIGKRERERESESLKYGRRRAHDALP